MFSVELFSHWETAPAVTFSFSASSAWLSPLACRNCLILSPIVSM